MVMVPLRGLELMFSATEYPTVPLPVPLLPDVTVMKLVLLLMAVQPQPPTAVTFTVPVAALAEKARMDSDVVGELVQGRAWSTAVLMSNRPYP